MGRNRAKFKDQAGARLRAQEINRIGFRLGGVFKVVCRDKDGNIKWTDVAPNIVVNVGLDHAIDVILGGAGEESQIHPWYLGVTDSSPTFAAGDTMASHGGWTENTTYSEANRQEFVDANTGTGQRDNTASVATITANGSSTAGGLFLVSDNTKGGTSGTLFSGAAFSGGDRSLVNLDTLDLTYTVSCADDGV